MSVNVADQFVVLELPSFQTANVVIAGGVSLDPSEEFLQQPPARQLERLSRGFKTLEELRADQRDNLLLASLVKLPEFARVLVTAPVR